MDTNIITTKFKDDFIVNVKKYPVIDWDNSEFPQESESDRESDHESDEPEYEYDSEDKVSIDSETNDPTKIEGAIIKYIYYNQVNVHFKNTELRYICGKNGLKIQSIDLKIKDEHDESDNYYSFLRNNSFEKFKNSYIMGAHNVNQDLEKISEFLSKNYPEWSVKLYKLYKIDSLFIISCDSTTDDYLKGMKFTYRTSFPIDKSSVKYTNFYCLDDCKFSGKFEGDDDFTEFNIWVATGITDEPDFKEVHKKLDSYSNPVIDFTNFSLAVYKMKKNHVDTYIKEIEEKINLLIENSKKSKRIFDEIMNGL